MSASHAPSNFSSATPQASRISLPWPGTCTSASIIFSACSRAGRASVPSASSSILTVEHAKSRLAATSGVLDLAGAVGLSGPGRLHDLFVTLEAMSPGEYKAGGAGLAIRYGVHESPFGAALVAVTARGICGLHFVDGDGDGIERLRQRLAWRRVAPGPRRHRACFRAALPSALLAAGPPAGPPRQGQQFPGEGVARAARASLRVACDLRPRCRADRAPGSARAVGTAIGANPIAWLIPCHRVIRESGALGGYRWGHRAQGGDARLGGGARQRFTAVSGNR